MKRYETSEFCTVCGYCYGLHKYDDDACPAGLPEGDGWAKTTFSPKSKAYTVIEKFSDNGEHSHFDLINAAGETVWSGSGQPSPQEESQVDSDWMDVCVTTHAIETQGIGSVIRKLKEQWSITRKQRTNQ